MRIFRPANPSKRLPAWLQNGTKENVLAQLGALVVWIVMKESYETYQDKKRDKKFAEKLSQIGN